MARATYEKLSESLIQQRAEGRKLREANQRLSETVIKLVEILSNAGNHTNIVRHVAAKNTRLKLTPYPDSAVVASR